MIYIEINVINVGVDIVYLKITLNVYKIPKEYKIVSHIRVKMSVRYVDQDNI